MDLINYRRRDCREVVIGGKVRMGAGAPVVIQSMTSTSSMDTEASVAQIRRIAGAGAEIVRLTAQGTREAENIGRMRAWSMCRWWPTFISTLRPRWPPLPWSTR